LTVSSAHVAPALFSPPSTPEALDRDPVISARALPLGKILRVLDVAVWQARTDPFEIVAWPYGAELAAGDGQSVFSPAAEGVGHWESIIYPPDLPTFRSALAALSSQPVLNRPIDYRIIVGDGELLWLRQWLLDQQPTEFAGRQLITGLIRVVSEEKRLQWEITRTSENERSRIGQEVHDDVCQVLTGISYLTHLLQQQLAGRQAPEAETVEQINLEIQAGLDRTRALAHGLVPAKSDFNTLQQALRDLARQVETRFGLQLIVTLPPEPPVFSQASLLHLYRIVQEGATNAFKHGRASRLDVTLALRENELVLAMEDNGSGLPPDSSRGDGVGLNVMRNRASLLGGRLELCNSSRGGALVKLHLPRCSES
jgi:signal transduction histidine kinase